MISELENDHKSLIHLQAIVGVSDPPGKDFTFYWRNIDFLFSEKDYHSEKFALIRQEKAKI